MPLDELASYNRARWNELVDADVMFSRPLLELTPATAKELIDPGGLIQHVVGEFRNKDVLCLASGGGQQSAAFAMLGAKVTVFDLSDGQLERDRRAAALHNLHITTVQGDMRELSAFDDNRFDLVFHAYSINFVPNVRPVFTEVARVLRDGGVYRLDWHNPFTQFVDDLSWTGEGYLISQPYKDGAETTATFPYWDVEAADGSVRRVDSPRAFVHSLSRIVNELATQGFVIYHAGEATSSDSQPVANPEPGSWAHYMAVVAPYLSLWCLFRRDVMQGVVA